jgi:hypothetical protein
MPFEDRLEALSKSATMAELGVLYDELSALQPCLDFPVV